MADQELLDALKPPPMRYWGNKKPPKNRADMFRVENAAGDTGAATGDSSNGAVATLRMYGPIDSYGGWFGISAKDVAAALDSLPETVTEVRVRINSPGGEAWEGMAILNLLRAHRAKVTTVVDGLAASAASFIAAAGEERVMSPGTQLMVHDASAFAIGDAATMEKARRMLDSVSDSIASIYAEHAGGSVADWRDTMREETWYTAAEAVDAGLADRVAVVRDEGATETAGEGDDTAGDDFEAEDRFAAAAARFDLSIFNHPGRAHAPAPKLPTASAGGSTPSEGRRPAVAFSDEQITQMRRQLGIAEDADEATILAALAEVLDEQAETLPPATPPAQPAAQQTPAPAAAAPSKPAAPTGTPGTMVIDVSAWEAIQERTKRLEAADAKRRREERDQVIDQAVREGKFPVARKEAWSALWDKDPEGTRAVIDGLAKNVVPVDEIGHALDDADIDEEFAHLFPPTQKGA